MYNLFRILSNTSKTFILLLSFAGAAEAQICAHTISTQQSSGACNNKDFGYTTIVANECPAWINIYLTDSTGFEHQQSIAPNSTSKIYDCAAPSKLTSWCYRYDSRKCDKHATRRPILVRNNKELILESYGRMVTLMQALSNKGMDHPSLHKYLRDAQGVLDGFYLSGSLTIMRSIESEINHYYRQVSTITNIKDLPDFRYVRFTPSGNYEKLVTPFLGRWSRIRNKPLCNAITEFISVESLQATDTNKAQAPKIVVAMYRDGAKILESEYQPLETQPNRLDLGKGGIVSIQSNRLLWNRGSATAEYVRCP